MSNTRPIDGPAPDYPKPLTELRASKRSSISAKVENNRNSNNNINKPMPWVVLCALIAGTAIGMQIRSEAVMDAKIAAAIAPANEVARTAAQNAKLAEDRANKMAAMLEARGLIKLENH